MHNFKDQIEAQIVAEAEFWNRKLELPDLSQKYLRRIHRKLLACKEALDALYLPTIEFLAEKRARDLETVENALKSRRGKSSAKLKKDHNFREKMKGAKGVPKIKTQRPARTQPTSWKPSWGK